MNYFSNEPNLQKTINEQRTMNNLQTNPISNLPRWICLMNIQSSLMYNSDGFWLSMYFDIRYNAAGLIEGDTL